MADGGGGGGDGGAADRDKKEQQRRGDAIDQINSYFGIAPSSAQVVTGYRPRNQPSARTVAGGGTAPGLPAGGFTAPLRTPNSIGQAVAAAGARQPPSLPGVPPNANGAFGDLSYAFQDPIYSDNPLSGTAATNKTGRDALYADTGKNVLDLNLNKLKDFSLDAERQRRQSLARKGQLGSSVDIDSSNALGRKYADSATDAQTQADQAALDFRTADEQSRLNLIQAINAGGDVNTGLANATNALRLNADAARTGANTHIINNTFGDLAQQYAYGQDLSGRKAANDARIKNAGLQPGNAGYRGTVSGGAN